MDSRYFPKDNILMLVLSDKEATRFKSDRNQDPLKGTFDYDNRKIEVTLQMSPDLPGKHGAKVDYLDGKSHVDCLSRASKLDVFIPGPVATNLFSGGRQRRFFYEGLGILIQE